MYAEKIRPLFWNGILIFNLFRLAIFFSAKRADPDAMPQPETKKTALECSIILENIYIQISFTIYM